MFSQKILHKGLQLSAYKYKPLCLIWPTMARAKEDAIINSGVAYARFNDETGADDKRPD